MQPKLLFLVFLGLVAPSSSFAAPGLVARSAPPRKMPLLRAGRSSPEMFIG